MPDLHEHRSALGRWSSLGRAAVVAVAAFAMFEILGCRRRSNRRPQGLGFVGGGQAKASAVHAVHSAGCFEEHGVDFSSMRSSQLALWMLQTADAQKSAAGPLLAHAARNLFLRADAEVLSLAMGCWALSNAECFDATLFTPTGRCITAGMVSLGLLPRGPEALANTASAWAKFCTFSAAQASPDPTPEDVGRFAPEGFLENLARAAAPRRYDFTMQQWALVTTCFAALGSSLLPFGDYAPVPIAQTVHKALQQLPPTTVVAQDPEGFRIHKVSDFMTPEESAEILRLAEPLWRPSRTYVKDTDLRTSDTASLRDELSLSSPVVQAIMARAAAAVGLPPGHCETLQLVRYSNEAQWYREHYDLLDTETQLLLGGQRVATVLVYLGSIPKEAGGETIFPLLDGLKVTPEERTAVVWPNVDPRGEAERLSQHAALPLRPAAEHGCGEVTKIAVNCWIRAFPTASQI